VERIPALIRFREANQRRAVKQEQPPEANEGEDEEAAELSDILARVRHLLSAAPASERRESA